MKKLLFRVDGSTEIGYGHLVRCICLAKYFRMQGHDCLFILKLSDRKVEALLGVEQLSFLMIQNESDIILQKEFSDKLILDINNKVLFKEVSEYRDHLSFLKQKGFLITAFEEFIHDPFPSDLVIIPYLGAENLIQSHVKTSRYLLGPDYFIFRDEFLLSTAVTISDEVKSLFICMGGTDPEKITEKLIGFLLVFPQKFYLKIIFAAMDKERENSLRKLLQTYQGGFEILINPSSISSLIVSSDLGMINSGLIKYETCLLGLPCISVSNSAEHESVMQLFSDNKLLKHMGIADQIHYAEFHSTFSSLVNDKTERMQLSGNALKMFDGKGIERVFNAIENLKN